MASAAGTPLVGVEYGNGDKHFVGGFGDGDGQDAFGGGGSEVLTVQAEGHFGRLVQALLLTDSAGGGAFEYLPLRR